jgi:Sulfotransferase domain
MSYRHIISIHGVPRSGTSWLGQIFNKHSDVAYKFQPLFAYRFRGRISLNSSPNDIRVFLDELYMTNDDDFISGNWPKQGDTDPFTAMSFYKKDQPDVMVMKEVRYHYLIEKFMHTIPDWKIIGIIRNPCAVIYSWLKNPKEFKRDWDIMVEWRHAPAKNEGQMDEYFGYEKWKELALSFLHFEHKYPENFLLIQYEQLVSKPIETMTQTFSFAGLEMEEQVIDFIKATQSHHIDDAYAVYKSPSVKDRWRSELDQRISEEIIRDIRGTVLERFLA